MLRAVTDAGELVPASGRGRLGPDDLLDRLASVRPSRVSGLAAGVDLLCRAAGDGPVVCLLGAVGPDDVADLIRGRSGPTADSAVLLDVGQLGRRRPGPRPARGGLRRPRTTLAGQRDAAAALLRASGWRVAVARADQSVPDVWAALAAPAGRASERAGSPWGRRHEPGGRRRRPDHRGGGAGHPARRCALSPVFSSLAWLPPLLPPSSSSSPGGC